MTLDKIHTAPLGLLVYMMLANGKINPDQSEALRMVHYIVYGGQLYRWHRNETGPGRELTGKLWDAVGNALNFGPWDLFEKLFPRSGRP